MDDLSGFAYFRYYSRNYCGDKPANLLGSPELLLLVDGGIVGIPLFALLLFLGAPFYAVEPTLAPCLGSGLASALAYAACVLGLFLLSDEFLSI